MGIVMLYNYFIMGGGVSSAENTYLVEPKQTPITPADTLVNYSSTVGMCLFNVTMLH